MLIHIQQMERTMNRGFILDTAKELTMGDRNKQHGDSQTNLGLAGSMKVMYWDFVRRHANRVIDAAEHEAIDMVITKLSRVATGTLNPDNYIDMAAYAAIAGQAATEYAMGPQSEVAKKMVAEGDYRASRPLGEDILRR